MSLGAKKGGCLICDCHCAEADISIPIGSRWTMDHRHCRVKRQLWGANRMDALFVAEGPLTAQPRRGPALQRKDRSAPIPAVVWSAGTLLSSRVNQCSPLRG